VLGIARISDPNKQQAQSLDDQQALYRRWLDGRVAGTYRLRMIAGSGSGERLDRKDLKRTRRLIRSGKCDLVICEDLGRIVRRIHALLICELCEDHGVRLIAINDQVDTDREDWRLASIFASMRHEAHNRDLRACNLFCVSRAGNVNCLICGGVGSRRGWRSG
jgi:DNA invertase Pin-like site-specific DNA recombinase